MRKYGEDWKMGKNDGKYVICMYIRISVEDVDVWKDSDAVKDVNVFGDGEGNGNSGKSESGSITAQRQLIYNFIRSKEEFSDCVVIEKCDDGFSGRKFEQRPQFMEMIDLARQGKIDCIIVKDFSRFGRDYIEVGNYLEQLFPFLGIRFISVNDHYDSALLGNGEVGGLDVAFKNVMHDFYSRETSEKLRVAWVQSCKKGHYRAAQTLYGYRKVGDKGRQLEVDPEAAEIVREIFRRKLEGWSHTEIARDLNRRGILTPVEYALSKGRTVSTYPEEPYIWHVSAIGRILRNERYTGTMVSGNTHKDRITGKRRNCLPEEKFYVEGTHEAIVSREDWLKVQGMYRIFPKGKCKQTKIHYRCGLCNRFLGLANLTKVYCSKGYVVDQEKQSLNCRNIRTYKMELDQIVLRHIRDMVLCFGMDERRGKKECVVKRGDGVSVRGKDFLRQHVQMRDGVQEMRNVLDEPGERDDVTIQEVRRLQKEIEVLKQNWRSVYEEYKDGVMDRDSFLLKRERMEQDREVLEKELDERMEVLQKKGEEGKEGNEEGDERKDEEKDEKSDEQDLERGEEDVNGVCESEVDEWLELFDVPELTEDMWKCFIDKILVYPGKKLEIFWKCKWMQGFGNNANNVNKGESEQGDVAVKEHFVEMNETNGVEFGACLMQYLNMNSVNVR